MNLLRSFKSRSKILVVAALALAVTGASAHTISIGSFNAGSPGSVTLVMGTYTHGSPIAQGSITLTGGPGVPPNITQLFTSVTGVKPLGLVDGVNNFYADSTPGTYGSLASDSFNSATNVSGLGAVTDWQAATFTGLSAGLYTYQLAGMTSANWTNINSFQNNWSGTLFIPEASITGVPDASTSLSLLGLSLLGLGVVRRRKSA